MGCMSCNGTGWKSYTSFGLHNGLCPDCLGSGTSKPAVTDYSKLEPPENPAFPWQPKKWQLLCYYCCEPIFLGHPYAGYRQRTLFWEGMWRHLDGEYNCQPEKIREGIERPRCHICGTQTSTHSGACSAAGKPGCHATTMSQKEEELIRMFGWQGNDRPRGNNPDAK